MKFIDSHMVAPQQRQAGSPVAAGVSGRARITDTAGFTMMEIAICLAIIGVALVAIVGVLPIGLNAQRDNREETIIGQDASLLMDAIRSGARGADDLTNYVIGITNFQIQYNNAGGIVASNNYGFNYNYVTVDGNVNSGDAGFALTNGRNIIGILSTPQYMDFNYAPTTNLLNGGYSNHVVAYFHSLSGPALEKPPQDNDILRSASFGYRVICVNSPIALDFNYSPYSRQIGLNQHELRLTFSWPLLPTGNVGPNPNPPLTFRSTIAGQLLPDPSAPTLRYFYNSQFFVPNTNAP